MTIEGELTNVQKCALIGAYNAPPGMFKPRKVVVDALVRKGYALRTHTGAITLTAAGLRYAELGEQS